MLASPAPVNFAAHRAVDSLLQREAGDETRLEGVKLRPVSRSFSSS
jgi:hypothetical protein